MNNSLYDAVLKTFPKKVKIIKGSKIDPKISKRINTFNKQLNAAIKATANSTLTFKSI